MLEFVNKFLFGGLLTTIVGILIVSKLSHKKVNLYNENLIIILFTALLITLFSQIQYDFTTTLIIFIIISYSYGYVFKIPIEKAVVLSFIVIILKSLAEIILILIIIFVFNFDINHIRDGGTVVYSLINTLVCGIAFYLLQISKIRQVLVKLLRIVNNQRKTITILFVLMEIIILGILFSKVGSNFHLNNSLFINILLIVALIVIFFIFMFEYIKSQELTCKYEQLVNYVKTFEDWMEREIIKNHENKNQLIVIKSLIAKSNKRALEYIQGILSNATVLEDLWLIKINKIPKGGLQGLIYYKIAQMRNENINLSLDISKELKKEEFLKININDYRDLCTVLGVYLDNAIEAVQLCQKKQIGIEFYFENNNIKIAIANTFVGKLKVDKFDKSGYSTKGVGRGYGLSLVKSIIKKNPKFFQSREITNGLYIQYLEIKVNDKKTLL